MIVPCVIPHKSKPLRWSERHDPSLPHCAAFAKFVEKKISCLTPLLVSLWALFMRDCFFSTTTGAGFCLREFHPHGPWRLALAAECRPWRLAPGRTGTRSPQGILSFYLYLFNKIFFNMYPMTNPLSRSMQ